MRTLETKEKQMNIRTCYSHLTDEELIRCAYQSDIELVVELRSRLARKLEAETHAPIYTRYVKLDRLTPNS